MEDPPRSIISKLFETVSSSLKTHSKRTPCVPKKKKESSAEPPPTPPPTLEKEDEGATKLPPSEGQETKKDPNDFCPEPKFPCPKAEPYLHPDQICPPRDESPPCCYIKMQDPCEPCCCEPEPAPSPCPHKCFPRPPRDPVCGCDRCKKGSGGKCCGLNDSMRGAPRDPSSLEKA